MRNYRRSTLLISILMVMLCMVLRGQGTAGEELWLLDNLEVIGSHRVMVSGDPEVMDTEMGSAVMFDGDGDRLLVDANPIGGAREFTLEVLFKPTASYPENREPRFVHIQDPDDPQQKRVMIELRINEQNLCYLDGFIRTDGDDLALIDETLTHPSGEWHHAAITFKQGTFTTYMDGKKELTGQVSYMDAILSASGKTSLGGRMDDRNWFNGLIRAVRVTHAALEPADFMSSLTPGVHCD